MSGESESERWSGGVLHVIAVVCPGRRNMSRKMKSVLMTQRIVSGRKP